MKCVAPHLGGGANVHGPHLNAMRWVTAAEVIQDASGKNVHEQSPLKHLQGEFASKQVVLEENNNNQVCLREGHQLD